MSLNLVRASKTALHQVEASSFQRVLLPDEDPEVGIGLTLYKLAPDQSVSIEMEGHEQAALALSGTGMLASAGRSVNFSRESWLETNPTVIHASAKDPILAGNHGAQTVEIIAVWTKNTRTFPPRYYHPSDVVVEHRGKGLLNETCHRLVRLVFDDTNGPPESNLVLGEVINFAGRWSSYPPHSHPQPEIYYYRFDSPQGYGYGELGDEVFKIRSGDLLAITGNRSHCQVSAPGYNMYYLWAVRHLEGNRYNGFTFDPQHAWTLKERSKS